MKKNLLTVLILALLVVNIVLTSIMMVSVMGTNKKTAELVTNIATALQLELTVPGEEEVVQISLEDTEVFNLTDAMTIALTPEDGKQSYIKFEAALSMNTKHEDYKKYGDLTEREILIKDVITSVVGSHTVSECQNDFESIRAEILQAVQELFQSDFIYNIAISEKQIGG